jgi:hypothetical protein
MTTAIDKKKESNHIDRLCKELGFPTSDHIPMEVVARYLNERKGRPYGSKKK